jgi:glutamate dehydrogenase (NAD(P)+)
MATSQREARSVWSVAQQELDATAERLKLDEGMHRVLRVPKRELEVHFPLRFEDGHVEAFTGYRVHHNLNRGPATGGIRFTADLTLDLVRANAMWNTWKAALVQIPYGGAFGGVIVNPRKLTPHEREGLTRRYATEIKILIGPERDVPSPDVNTGSQTMAWIMDTYSMHLGYTVAGVVSGKPEAIGGTTGRREATSRGAFRVALAGAASRGIKVDGARVAIQGFGRVGSTLAELLAGAGARIVAIADDRSAVRNDSGIQASRAVAWLREHDTVAGLPETEAMSRESIFETDCEILISAGLQDQVTAGNAGAVRAKVLVEAANGPTSPEGDAILRDRGVTVLPDILCTSGGMVISYFEWVQDIQSFFWTDEEIRANLDRTMDVATAEVMAMAKSEKVDLRRAAMMVAVKRVADATTLRGLYP